MISKRKKDLLAYKKQLMTVAMTWACCFIVFLLAYLFVLAPQFKNRKNVEDELAMAKQDYSFAMRATQAEPINQLKKEIELLQDQASDFIIEFEDLANLTFDISKRATDKSLNPFSIKNKYGKISKIPDCEYIGENEIDINFTCNFEQFTSFLSDMERHQPIVFVDDFILSRPRGRKKQGLSVNMNVSVFIRK